MLFIVIHQVYELWFKEMLHEIEKVKRDFSSGDLWGAIHTLKRRAEHPQDPRGAARHPGDDDADVLQRFFATGSSALRDSSRSSTGGGVRARLPPRRHARFSPEGSPARRTLERRLAERSLVDHFYDFLALQGVEIPARLRARDLSLPNGPTRRSSADPAPLPRARRPRHPPRVDDGHRRGDAGVALPPREARRAARSGTRRAPAARWESSS